MLHDIAILNIAVSGLLAAWSISDLRRHPPQMPVMKWVWPLTFLWGGVFALITYLWFGRAPHKHSNQEARHSKRPMWQSVVLGATHCGAGCSLADLIVEGGLFLLGISFVVLGHKVFGNWLVDYVMALLTGIAFQYGAHAPMSNAPRGQLLWQSLKSDVLSLSSWQIGMYGWMAICIFVLFDENTMSANHWSFWLMMQVAMLAGFLTACPVNWLLIRSGVKEAM